MILEYVSVLAWPVMVLLLGLWFWFLFRKRPNK